MSLDAPKSDAQLLRELDEKMARRARVNDVELGPDSPLRPGRASHARPTARSAKRVEHEIQVALFANVRHVDEVRRRPALAMVFAVPNGGFRSIGTAIRLKLEGVVSGPPDVWCPVPRGGYVGLVIEIKKPGGTLAPEQADWLAALAREGWKTALHTTPDGAWAELVDYLDQPRTETL